MTEANLGCLGKKQELEESSQSKELSVWFLIIPLMQLPVALGIIPSISYFFFKIRVKFLPWISHPWCHFLLDSDSDTNVVQRVCLVEFMYVCIDMYMHIYIRQNHTEITEYLTIFNPQNGSSIWSNHMTWKLCLRLCLHKTIIQIYSLDQRYKLLSNPYKCPLIQIPAKCKFSLIHFTSDHM